MYESTTISLSGNTTELSTNFFPSLTIAEDSEIALLNLQTYNSFPNINESNNKLRIIIKNNTIINKRDVSVSSSSSLESDKNAIDHNPRHLSKYFTESYTSNINKSSDFFSKSNEHILSEQTDKEILKLEIEPGCYELSQINEYIKNMIKKTHPNIVFSIFPNINTFKSYVYCSETIDFTIDNSLRHVLGFDEVELEPNKLHESQKTVNISMINSIKVLCSIAQGSFDGNKPSHSVYEFYPTAVHGSKIVEAPSNLIYYPLITNEINNITVKLVDQDQRPLKNLGEKITTVFHIRRYGS